MLMAPRGSWAHNPQRPSHDDSSGNNIPRLSASQNTPCRAARGTYHARLVEQVGGDRSCTSLRRRHDVRQVQPTDTKHAALTKRGTIGRLHILLAAFNDDHKAATTPHLKHDDTHGTARHSTGKHTDAIHED